MKKSKTSFSNLRSSIGRNSSSQELKFIYSTRATLTYQNRRILPKIQKRRFGEIGFFKLRRCSRGLLRFYYTPRGRDSSYSG